MSGPKVPFVCCMLRACMEQDSHWVWAYSVVGGWASSSLFSSCCLETGSFTKLETCWLTRIWLLLVPRIYLSLHPDTEVRGMHGHAWLSWGPGVLSSGLHTYEWMHVLTEPSLQSCKAHFVCWTFLNWAPGSFLHANLYQIKVETVSPSTPLLILFEIPLLTV